MKLVTEPYYNLDCYEFNDLVKKTYGHQYDFIADMECGNDTSHTFKMKKEPLFDFDKDDLAEFIKTGRYSYLYHTIFQDLVNRDILPEGNYIIEVCW